MLVVDGVEMLDVRETAQLVGRTPETVRRWIWAGRLAPRRHGAKLLVARRDVEALQRGETADAGPSLEAWAAAARQQAREGRLGAALPGASAADLVVGDRAGRQAG